MTTMATETPMARPTMASPNSRWRRMRRQGGTIRGFLRQPGPACRGRAILESRLILGHTHSGGDRLESVVEGGQRQTAPQGQLQVGRVVNR